MQRFFRTQPLKRMNLRIWSPLVVLALLLVFYAFPKPSSAQNPVVSPPQGGSLAPPRPDGSPSAAPRPDTMHVNRARYIALVLAQIKGREQEPAGQVFKNVQLLKDMPAEQFVRLMDVGYGKALNTSCRFCHDFSDWAADTRDHKVITRDMITMTDKINNEMLRNMKSLDHPETAQITCATCHNGRKRPALTVN